VVQIKKLIEVALPLPEINNASAYDKMPGIGPHPKGIHHWWARLPLPTARAVLFASVVDDPSSHPDKFPTEDAQNKERERLFDIVRELMQKKLHEKPEVYAKARQEMLQHTGGVLPPVLDPFSGGGSIPLEAARLGFEAHAADLNPVAVLLNKCNLELIPRWLDRQPVNPDVRGNVMRIAGWSGAKGLAEDVRYYGNLIRKRALEKIGHLYPKIKLPSEYGGHEANIIAWIWARTVASPNPAVHGAHVPLISTYWLSSKKRSEAWLSPIIDKTTNSWRFEIKTKEPPDRSVIQKGTTQGKRKAFICLLSKTSIDYDHIRQEGQAGKIGVKLIAIVAEAPRGRIYIPANDSHYTIAVSCSPDLVPDFPLLDNPRDFSTPNYGLKTFGHLFTQRQLTSMVTLSDLVRDVAQDVLKDTQKAGIPDTEAKNYAETVSTFLSLALGRCADFNNSLCRWKPSGQQSMQLFCRQAIPMVWDFCEPNIMGEKAVCWKTAVEICADALERIPISGVNSGRAAQVDASGAWNNVHGLLVSTDPPYYDNIGYAALSDFFYVWLRRTIGDLYPDLFKTILVPKTPELTASPGRFDGDKEKAKEHFESGFRKAFATLREKMDPRFPLTVYYAFKQKDENAGSDEDSGVDSSSSNGVDLTTGWETLLEALLGSGFQITATWPVRASQKWRMVSMGTNALASSIVLACRARPADAPQCTRRDFLNALKKELPPALAYLQQGNIAPVDLAQATIGPGMAVYSRYSKVIESSGKAMTVRTALALINQMLDEVLGEMESEYDADTRWALAWFEQYGTSEGDFGEAETLSRAKNTGVNGLVEAGIVASRGGTVRLLKREELLEDWNPATDKRLTVWEATQYLIRALDQDGETGAALLLRKMSGNLGETARELAYRLHKLCDGKGWSAEAQVYNGLVLAWPELTKLAQALPEPQQLTLQ
jgi:putative DNA methylase